MYIIFTDIEMKYFAQKYKMPTEMDKNRTIIIILLFYWKKVNKMDNNKILIQYVY